MQVLLDTAYFPPVQYFAALSASSRQCFFLEACENYQKQSYRNRCHFYSASGLQSLSFPVVHGNGTVSLPITEIRIDYSRPWLQQHKRAIVSAYGSSAFFEYFRDELFDILDSRPETLWEMILAIIRFFIDKIGIPVEIGQTSEFTLPSGLCGDGVWAGLPLCCPAGLSEPESYGEGYVDEPLPAEYFRSVYIRIDDTAIVSVIVIRIYVFIRIFRRL